MRLGRWAEPHSVGTRTLLASQEQQDPGRGLVENKNCVDEEYMGGGRNGSGEQRQLLGCMTSKGRCSGLGREVG